jgi:hypothetical protein
MSRVPAPPKGTGAAGRRLWREVNADFELSGADLEVLRDAVTIADRIEALKPMLALGPFMKGSDGLPRANPAMVQERLLMNLKAKQLAAIRVIGDVGEDEHDRPQRRVGFKGVYGGKLRAVP